MKNILNLFSPKKQTYNKETPKKENKKVIFNMNNPIFLQKKSSQKHNQSLQNINAQKLSKQHKPIQRQNSTDRESFIYLACHSSRHSSKLSNLINPLQNTKIKQTINKNFLISNQQTPKQQNLPMKKINKYKYYKTTTKTQQNSSIIKLQYKLNTQIEKQNIYVKNNKQKQCIVKILYSENIVISQNSLQYKKKQYKQIKQFSVKITTSDRFVNYVKNQLKDVVNFSYYIQSQPSNITLDLCLSLQKQSFDLSYLNKTTLTLCLIPKIKQKRVNLTSFQILKYIGYGGFSKVFLCRFKQDGKFYAMKLIPKSFITRTKKANIIMNQKSIMQSLSHPFIIQMKFSFQSLNHLVFILQYCPGGQIFKQIKQSKRLSQQSSRFYMTQILLGLQQIHKNGIIYRDFKPQNILLDINGNVKIADFGLAKPNYYTNKDRAYSFCGSAEYMAPEMILKQGHTLSVDFYCIGAVLYEFVTGLPPFYSQKTEDIYKSAVNEEITFPYNIPMSYELKSLLKGLLCKHQKYRLGSMMGVKQILSHPWFKKISKEKYLKKQITPPVRFTDISYINIFNEQLFLDNQQNVNLIKKQQVLHENSQNANEKLQNSIKQLKYFQYDYRYPNARHHKDQQIIQSQVEKTFKKSKLGKVQPKQTNQILMSSNCFNVVEKVRF